MKRSWRTSNGVHTKIEHTRDLAFVTVCFQADSTTAVSTQGHYEQMKYQNVNVNVGGCTIDANGTVTIPYDGCYIVSQTTTFTPNIYYKSGFFNINTASLPSTTNELTRWAPTDGDLKHQMFEGTSVIFLEAGDLLRVWMYSWKDPCSSPASALQKDANTLSIVRIV